jgi:pimeloyl-ACP methyl ester carboxylesterase
VRPAGSAEPAAPTGKREEQPRLLAVFIGGMDSDPTPEQIAGTSVRNEGRSGMFQLCGELKQKGVQPEYFNWNGTRAGGLSTADPPWSPAIAAFVREHAQKHPRCRVALVGNSWGGQTAFEVIEELRRPPDPVPVQLVVFLDASSAGRKAGPPKSLPDNADRIVQYRTRNVFVWPALPADKRLESIDLGSAEAGYIRDGRPAYNASFDFAAHVAAEWDPRIHADIRRRLLDLIKAE